MKYKRLVIGLATCLAVVNVFSATSASALTMTDLINSNAIPQVKGATAYPVIPITSRTNQTVKITAQAQSFDGTNWIYLLSWNRKRQAQGSIYVSLRSNISNKVLSVDNANPTGSQTF